jgi:mRNA interferase MazF
MKEGDCVIALLPQADGSLKRRPAIVLRLMPPFGDFLLCGVSTQLHRKVEDFDEIISTADADFVASGLKAPSLIRLGFLIVYSRKDIVGVAGSVSTERHKRLLQNLSDYLIK